MPSSEIAFLETSEGALFDPLCVRCRASSCSNLPRCNAFPGPSVMRSWASSAVALKMARPCPAVCSGCRRVPLRELTGNSRRAAGG